MGVVALGEKKTYLKTLFNISGAELVTKIRNRTGGIWLEH